MVGPMRFMVLLGVWLLPSLLPAESGGKNPLNIELISEMRSIRAGSSFCLGLHLRHPAGSHTYWKHPGVVGLATQVEWELPPGFTAGEIQWPAPAVVKMADYQAQGYQGETLVIIPLTAPAFLTTKTVVLTARVSWMCCGNTCHPAARIPFSVTLPVAAAAEPDPVTRPLFAKFRAQVPRRDPAWQAAANREQDRIVLTLQAPGPIPARSDADGIHFFTADGQVDSNQKQQVDILSDGRIRMKLALAENAPPHAATLPGVVVLPGGCQGDGLPFQLEINPGY